MSGIRIYELAKQVNMKSKEVLKVAQSHGMDFNSHMSSISEEEQAQLIKWLKGGNQSAKDQKKAVSAEDQSSSKTKESPKNKKESKSHSSSVNHSKDKEHVTTKEKNPKKEQRLKGHQQSKERQSDEEDTLSRSKRRGGRRDRRRQGRNNSTNNKPQSKGITARKHKDLPEEFHYTEGINIQDIAKAFHRDATEIIKKLLMQGVMANQNQALSTEVIELICLEYGVEPIEKVQVDESDLDVYFENADKPVKAITRPAVVTIMGHVDHGKTSLLDALRHSRVTEGEAGGITQHIGAYQIEVDGKPVTFLDTPGHAAFTTMRARGANVTDIVVIVVAADDGVMPQTVEAINHAKAADVPIIVAINKIDKPEANPDRVMNELTEYGIVSEAWGGDTIFVNISAKFKQNLDELLEMIILVAEMQELKADPDRLALGSVIEARLDKATGATVTLLVQHGSLHVGDPIVVGNTYGRVRTMVNDQGRRIRQAGPSTPVEITGLNDAPLAGDKFVVFEDEKTARHIGEERAQKAQERSRDLKKKVTLDNLFETLQEEELRSVNVLIKADVQGSVEALAASLLKIDVEGVKVNIVHQAVGAINESDVTLANASSAIVIGFNVRPTPQARSQAEVDQVDIRLHNVIYNVIDEIETAMKGTLDPEYVEEITGQVIVRETYTVSKLGTIAGSYVLEGFIERSSKVRVIRDNIVIYDGEIASLKRFKDDAREVNKGLECGIMIEGYNDLKVDDILEPYRMVEVERK